MARTNRTPRMSTDTRRNPPPPSIVLPIPQSVLLKRNGSVQQNNACDPAREKIRKLKADFMRAKKLMKEAQEIMAQVEIAFLDLEKTDFQDVDEILKEKD